MATKQELINAIAGDLHRTDLTTQITTAIDSAVSYYGRKRFWWLEDVTTFTTSASQVYYSVPTDFKAVDGLLATVSSNKYPVDRVNFSEIDDVDSGVVTGTPDTYAIYKNQIRLYPPPNGAYVMTLSYHKNLDAPSASGSNAWTSDAFDLIRFRAEWDVVRHVLHDYERAAVLKDSEAEAFANICSETEEKLSSGIKKEYW